MVLPTINKDRDQRLCEPGFLSSATKCSRLHGTTPQTSAKYLSNKKYASAEQERCYKQTSGGSCLVFEARTILLWYVTQLGPNFYQG